MWGSGASQWGKPVRPASQPVAKLAIKLSGANRSDPPAASQQVKLERPSGVVPVRSGNVSLAPKVPLGVAAKPPVTRATYGIAAPSNPAQVAEKAATLATKEAADGELFKKEMPEVMELVNLAEDAVEAVAVVSAPMSADGMDTAEINAGCDEVEKLAIDAQEKLGEARKSVTLRLTAARRFAPQAMKVACEEYTKMQNTVSEAQKKLHPYKTFKPELQRRVAAKKAIADITEKLATAELEIEKAVMMTQVAGEGQMPEEEIQACEDIAKAAARAMSHLNKLVTTCGRTSDSSLNEELDHLKTTAQESKGKLDAVQATLRTQQILLSVEKNIELARAKMAKADEAMKKCEEAEMPFLKGIEVLPHDESNKAITESEKTAQQTDIVLKAANLYIKQQLAAATTYPADVKEKIGNEYEYVKLKGEHLTKKLASFKQETTDRKLAFLMSSVVEPVKAVEDKVAQLKEAAKEFTSKELTAVDAQKKELVMTIEKDVQGLLTEARKVLKQKQQKHKGAELAQGIQSFSKRLNDAQTVAAIAMKDIHNAEKLIKCKDLLTELTTKQTEAADTLKQVQQKAEMKEELSESAIEKLVEDIEATSKTAKSAQAFLSANGAGAPSPIKEELATLSAKFKSIGEAVEKVRGATRDQREKVLASSWVKEGMAKVDEMEQLIEKANEVEIPFLKGIEVVSVKDALEKIGQSEEIVTSLTKLIADNRNYIAAKSIELKKSFDAERSKVPLEEFGKISDSINITSNKLSSFKKDTEIRKRLTNLMDGAAKLTELEEELQNVEAATAPFTAEDKNEDDEMTEACAKFTDLRDSARGKMNALKASLAVWQKDPKIKADHSEPLKKLHDRLTAANVAMGNSKKAAGDHLDKFRAKKLIAEAEEQLQSAEDCMQKATEACQPLLKEMGLSFLVQASIDTISSKLLDHTDMKGAEAIFKKAAGSKKALDESAFTAFLTKLPETIQNDAVTFTNERRVDIFKAIAKGDSVGLEEFKTMLPREYRCVQSVTMTTAFSISDSKTVGKVEKDDELVCVGAIKKDESTGMERMEFKVVKNGNQGFVTVVCGDTTYCVSGNKYRSFVSSLDGVLEEQFNAITKVNAFFKANVGELRQAKAAPLVDARKELYKLQTRAAKGVQDFEGLRKKLIVAKRDYRATLETEKTSYLVAKEQKQADELLEKVNTELKAVEVVLEKVDVEAAKITSLSEKDQKEFATPQSVLSSVIELTEEVKKLCETAKDAVKDVKEHEAVKDANKGPLVEAKKECAKITAKIGAAERKAQSSVRSVKKACEAIAKEHYETTSAWLRAELLKKKSTARKMFDDVVKKDEDVLSKDKFATLLKNAKELKVSKEHMGLLFDHIQAGGITRRKFLGFVQQHYVVQKPIALTDVYEIAKAKILRRAENDEIIETLEATIVDETTGLTRIRGKCLMDGLEGWVTIKGNQGTPFLQEVEKPYYCTSKSVAIETEFKGGSVIRDIRVDEVFELLEGPKKEAVPDAQRARIKCPKDGATGWFTLKDSKGVEFAKRAEDVHIISSSVAMTDELSVKESKVLRKLAPGELFDVLGEAEVDENISRIKAKMVKDELVGYITLKGNAGTEYTKQSTKHYKVTKSVPLGKSFKTDSEGKIRDLDVDEIVEVVVGPKAEEFQPLIRVRGRVLGDDKEGWISLKEDTTVPWNGRYKALKAQPLQETSKVDSKELRALKEQEVLDILQGPLLVGEGEKAVLRMKGRAKDGTIGWASLRDAEDKQLLRC